MTARHRCRSASAVVIVAAWLLLWSPFAAARAGATSSPALTVTVTSVSPNSPPVTTTPSVVQFTLALSNNSDTALTGVRVTAVRGEPITTEQALGSLSLSPQDHGGSELDIASAQPVTADVPAHASVDVTFTTSVSTLTDAGAGICECHDAVYPIFFRASAGSTEATTGTYLPVSYGAVQQVHVGWLWPLIDRPHRLASDSVFTDDELAEEVSPGGRLDRALAVVEAVDTTVPITVVVDPETIDELAVMAAGPYTYTDTKGTSHPGTGTSAAATWLTRLSTVVNQPDVTVDELPYSDPDVQTLASHGIGWQTGQPSAMASRVRRALDGAQVSSDLAWPASTHVGEATARRLVATGARTLALSSASVTADQDSSQVQPGVVTVAVGSQQVPVLQTPATLAQLVADGVTVGGSGVQVVPRLDAELAVRVTEPQQFGESPGGLLLTAPRYVDPDVATAAAIIRSSTSGVYSVASPVAALTAAPVSSYPQAELAAGETSGGLPSAVLSTIEAVTRAEGSLKSLLVVAPTASSTTQSPKSAQTLLDSLPEAVQRLESSAFRSSGGIGDNEFGVQLSRTLATAVAKVQTGVQIVPPTSGSYTLASGRSHLPVTIINNLPYEVRVNVVASLPSASGLPVLTTTALVDQSIAASTKVTVQLPVQVQRSGRVKVQITLQAANGFALGSPILLSVHTTAFGKLGTVVMIVAGTGLVLAVLRRWYLSAVRRRRRGVADDGPDPGAATGAVA